MTTGGGRRDAQYSDSPVRSAIAYTFGRFQLLHGDSFLLQRTCRAPTATSNA